MKVRILPEAEADLARAADFYDAQAGGLGDYFIECLSGGKSAQGTLSEEEREEYESCVSAGTFIAILQAKARTIVSQSGAA